MSKRAERDDRHLPAPKLIENLDFYFENGMMVLTAHFLEARGYCCGNNCRHCPYLKTKTENGKSEKKSF